MDSYEKLPTQPQPQSNYEITSIGNLLQSADNDLRMPCNETTKRTSFVKACGSPIVRSDKRHMLSAMIWSYCILVLHGIVAG